MATKQKNIENFDLEPGRIIARKFEVLSRLGAGWEGEVYHIREISTGIERAMKLFFPERNQNNRSAKLYARKLHRLRHCPIVIHYHTEERFIYQKQEITALVSEYVDGELLGDFLKRQPGKRLHPFQAVHLLHALAVGVEGIHQYREYHGDLHPANVIISRFGLGFDLKILDLFHWNAPKRENIQDDITDMIKIFYDSLGGQKHYAKQPTVVKEICCGLKRSLILARFKTVSQLRAHLERLRWD